MPSATHHRFMVWSRGSRSLQAWSPSSAGSHKYAGADITTPAALPAPDRGSAVVWGQAARSRAGAGRRIWVECTQAFGLCLPHSCWSPCSGAWLCRNLRCSHRAPRGRSRLRRCPWSLGKPACEPVQGRFPWDLTAAAESHRPPSTVTGCSGHRKEHATSPARCCSGRGGMRARPGAVLS